MPVSNNSNKNVNNEDKDTPNHSIRQMLLIESLLKCRFTDILSSQSLRPPPLDTKDDQSHEAIFGVGLREVESTGRELR